MIIPKLGLMMLLTASVGLAQQPSPPPPQPNPPALQAVPQPAVSEPEFKRFEEIMDRRGRGETVSVEDQRFAREIMTRINRMIRPAAGRQPVQQQLRLRANQGPMPAPAPQPRQTTRPPLERALGVPGGRWWTRPEMAQRLGLTADQTKKMDDIFQQHRLKLIDLNAAVQREEAIMEPLIGAEQPDEAKITTQIDKVAQARAELEKANARMLLGIRRLLTPEQWNNLKAQAPAAPQPVRP